MMSRSDRQVVLARLAARYTQLAGLRKHVAAALPLKKPSSALAAPKPQKSLSEIQREGTRSENRVLSKAFALAIERGQTDMAITLLNQGLRGADIERVIAGLPEVAAPRRGGLALRIAQRDALLAVEPASSGTNPTAAEMIRAYDKAFGRTGDQR